MIWLAIALLAAIALAPLALSLRRTAAARGRQEAAIALHRAQLAELDRDLADGRIAVPEHASAVLEVQRRLLAADSGGEAESRISSRGPVLVALLLLPLGAFALYLLGGSPDLPAQPLADRIALAREREAREAALIASASPAARRDRSTFRAGASGLHPAGQCRGESRPAAGSGRCLAHRARHALRSDDRRGSGRGDHRGAGPRHGRSGRAVPSRSCRIVG